MCNFLVKYQRFLILFLYIIFILPASFFAFYIDYDISSNSNILYFESENVFQIFSNDNKTIYKLIFDSKEFEQSSYKINKGPMKEISSSKDTLTIKFLYPMKNVEVKKDKITFYGYLPVTSQKVSFEKIKLNDAIEMIFNYVGWNWIKTDEIPDANLSVNSKKISVEYFLRMLAEVYSLNTTFYDENTLLLGKNSYLFENDLPLFIENIEKISSENAVATDESTLNSIIFDHSKIHNSQLEEDVLILLESKYDLTSLQELFNCKVVLFDGNQYAILAKESQKEKIDQLLEYLDSISTFTPSTSWVEIDENIEKDEKTIKNEKEIEESYEVFISEYDLSFLSDIFPVRVYKLDDNNYFIQADKGTLSLVEGVIEIINTKTSIEEDVKLSEEKKVTPEATIKKEIVSIPVKMTDFFDKIFIEEKIKFSKVSILENNVLYLLEYEENQKEFVQNIFNVIDSKDTKVKITLKELISLIAEIESINVISDFENDKELYINNFDIDMHSLQPYLVTQDVMYEKIGENTYRFFEQKKLLKYEVFLFSGQNIDRFTIEELYLLTKQFDGIISNGKDSASLISKPVIYVNEEKEASIKSVLSVPVFDEDGKIISKIESGFVMKIYGSYDNITDVVDTQLQISISELKSEEKNIVDERSISSHFIIPNGGFIKLGGLNFTSVVENKTGIPILKDIPVVGKLFTSYNKTENIYDLFIIINVEVLNGPQFEDYF